MISRNRLVGLLGLFCAVGMVFGDHARIHAASPLDQSGEAVQEAYQQAWATLEGAEGLKTISWRVHRSGSITAPVHSEAADGLLEPARPTVHGTTLADLAQYIERNQPLLAVHRRMRVWEPPGLALVSYVRSHGVEGSLLIKIDVKCIPEGDPKVAVEWDGQRLGTIDTRSPSAEYRDFGFVVPGPVSDGAHELRIASLPYEKTSRGYTLIRSAQVAAIGELEFGERPELPRGGELEVWDAYYRPDPDPYLGLDSEVVHPNFNISLDDPAEFGSLHVFLRNTGSQPVRVDDRRITLNGIDLDSLLVDLRKSAWDARGIVWWRIRPRMIPPGDIGELLIRFRRRPAGEAARITVPTLNANSASCPVPYAQPPLRVDYVALSPRRDQLYFYLRQTSAQSSGRLAQLLLDGQRLERVRFYGDDFAQKLALAVADLSEPMLLGDHHVVTGKTSDAQTASAQFLAQENFFMLSAFSSWPTIVEKRDEVGFNTQMMGHGSPDQEFLDQLTSQGIRSIVDPARISGFGEAAEHPNLLAWYLLDEPDAHDATVEGNWFKALGYYARQWQRNELPRINRFGGGKPSMCLANLTGTPLNWYVYGQTADIFATDPYVVRYWLGGLPMVWHFLELARQASTPRPVVACLQGYAYHRDGTPSPTGPTPAEFRVMALYALGTAPKGYTIWALGRDKSGIQNAPDSLREMSRLWHSFASISRYLTIATPIDAIAQTSDQVWARALLCGPHAMVISVVNTGVKHPADHQRVVEPAEDASVTVALPSFLPKVRVYRVDQNGPELWTEPTAAGTVKLNLGTLEAGEIFLLRRD